MLKRPALVLIDVQNDYLQLPGIEPHPATVVAEAARLLRGFRERGYPVLHVRTKSFADGEDRMPHWQQRAIFACRAGSIGYAAPDDLGPRQGEPVFDKTFFSAFSVSGFESYLKNRDIQTLILSGLFLQTCLRQTALDGYQRGFHIHLAVDASGSHDPLHGAITVDYLGDRAMTPLGTAELFRALDQEGEVRLPPAPVDLDSLVGASRRAQRQWAREPIERRSDKLNRFAVELERHKERLAELIVAEVRKPITLARGEVDRSAALLRAVAARFAKSPQKTIEREGEIRLHARGVIAMITPWNNPLAIPIGKLAPALAHGNAVLWKPSPRAGKVAHALAPLMVQAGFPQDVVTVVEGDQGQGRRLIAADIDAVAFSGSSRTGWSIIAQAAARLLPIQAELGGNNGAIVASSADLESAAAAIVEGAFGFAGQRCTSNRRVIVVADVCENFLIHLEAATRQLAYGDAKDEKTLVGPMISAQAAQAVASLVKRARSIGLTVVQPHVPLPAYLSQSEAFHPPTIIVCDNPKAFIVQEESFGPILVVQPARDFAHALQLLNDVPYGLVAAVFSSDAAEQAQFLESAEAGIVKLNTSTVNAGVDLPFTGWKHSGYGAAEHGEANAEVFSKRQAVYL